MNTVAAIAILVALFAGPILLAPIERNLEPYFLAVGIIAVSAARAWSIGLIIEALRAPILVTIAVVVAGVIFARFRPRLDDALLVLRGRIARPILTAMTVFILAIFSSVITGIVAAIVLAEAVGLLRLGPPSRNNVVIAGCFAIGLGSALTPAGEPLSALAASILHLSFFDLLRWFGPWIIPTIFVLSLLAGYFARGDYDLIAEEAAVRETIDDALLQGARIFIFVAGLVLVGRAFEPQAEQWLLPLGRSGLFWANTISAALDNATLVALEARAIGVDGLPWAIASLLIAGGILIPGNIPNIVCAGKLGIRSLEWARLGIPLGLVMLGIAFAILRLS